MNASKIGRFFGAMKAGFIFRCEYVSGGTKKAQSFRISTMDGVVLFMGLRNHDTATEHGVWVPGSDCMVMGTDGRVAVSRLWVE